jgi:tyrosine-protein kinase Etk/Wzc
MNQSSKPNASQLRRSSQPAAPDEIQFGEWLADLWEGRYLIAATTAFFVVAGGFLIWRAAPVYQAESILQLKEKPAPGTETQLNKIEGMTADSGDPSTEVEILKTDLILGRAVKALSLDIHAEPKLLPIIGPPMVRGRADAPILEIASFQIPERMVGKIFHVTAQKDGSFQWRSPAGLPLAQGKPGDGLSAVLDGDVLRLKVRSMTAKPGQDFRVFRKPLVAAIGDLRGGFEAVERAKGTNVLALTYKSFNPTTTADTLNAIVNQYIQYKLEKKAGDANKTRALLEAKMVPLKAALDEAENRLNGFRSHYGSVDLSREAEALLLQTTALNTQISALEQKKQEALRTYRENSDVVTTLNRQIEKLQSEANQVGGRMKVLPGTQQEVVRLSRDVQVNNELYTALLNSVQQLQVTNAGALGSIAIVDPATVNPEPIGAKPSMLMAFYASLGLMAGIGLTALKHLLKRGIKDHRTIESKLGLPVLVTIPHSREQDTHSAAMEKRQEGIHLLALQNPDDLAIESLRSLRTSLLFMLKESGNRTIMVTGPSPAVGKSFLSTNLALILTQTGTRVLLVDADLRRGTLHRYFGRKSRLSGLSDILSGRANWKDMAQPTEVPGLDLVSTGIIPGDSAQLLLSPAFAAFIASAKEAYDYVILDVPPMLPVTDATIISAHVGTVLLVAKFGVTALDEIQVCQSRMEAHGIAIAGCIFNDITPMGLGYGYQDYRYSYHYNYK